MPTRIGSIVDPERCRPATIPGIDGHVASRPTVKKPSRSFFVTMSAKWPRLMPSFFHPPYSVSSSGCQLRLLDAQSVAPRSARIFMMPPLASCRDPSTARWGRAAAAQARRAACRPAPVAILRRSAVSERRRRANAVAHDRMPVMASPIFHVGSVSRARQPRASLRFSSVSDPPWPSAICRHRTRPMPDPPGLVVKKGTNRFDVLARPGPSSSTAISRFALRAPPAHGDGAAANFEAGVGGVAQQVDQQLFELIGVGVDRDVGARS